MTQKLQTIWILSTGTRGDIQPFTAVGAALVKRGYSVRFFTNADYAHFVEGFGMTGIAVRPSNDEVYYNNPKVMAGMASGDAMKSVNGLISVNEATADKTAEVIQGEIEKNGLPDLTISSPMMAAVSWYLAIHKTVPCLDMACQAFIYNPSRMQFGMPTLPFGLHYYLLFNVLVGSGYRLHSAYDRALEIGMKEHMPREKLIEYVRNPNTPQIILLSPILAKTLYPYASPYHRFVGTTVIESKIQVSNLKKFGDNDTVQTMKTFLGAGKKPVYLGWGSMISRSPEYMVEFCAHTVYHSGERAIVLGGEAKMSQELLASTSVDPKILEYARSNILFVESAPHEWLFPKVAATVHHGGAGSVSAALKAGVPTIVTPVFADQFDHSHMVNDLGVGVGFTKQLQKIGWKELGDAICMVLSDKEMQKRCAELGEKLCVEDGANGAADEVERFWTEYCVTGKFYVLFREKRTKESNTSLLVTLAVAGVIAVGAVVVARRR